MKIIQMLACNYELGFKKKIFAKRKDLIFFPNKNKQLGLPYGILL